MNGRGHQTARPRQRLQRGLDVGRVERPSGMQREAALHDHQHRGLQAVHVLGRYRAEDGHAALRLYAQTLAFGPRASGEPAP